MYRELIFTFTFLSGIGCAATPVVPQATPKSAPFDVSACGPEIANLQNLGSAPLILLGELHGLTAPPAFAVDLACRLAAAGKPVLLALEIPNQEQARIDAFLASSGDAAARAALLAGAFWHRPPSDQDGRSSAARVDLLDAVRRLRARGLALRLSAIDAETVTAGRDQAMAEALLAARRPGEIGVLLIGNLHIRTRPGAPWDPKVMWSGVYLREKEPALLSLDNRYAAGEAWLSIAGKPPGVTPVKGSPDAARDFGIQRFEKTDENGIDGRFDVGAAVASPPAVPAP